MNLQYWISIVYRTKEMRGRTGSYTKDFC